MRYTSVVVSPKLSHSSGIRGHEQDRGPKAAAAHDSRDPPLLRRRQLRPPPQSRNCQFYPFFGDRKKVIIALPSLFSLTLFRVICRESVNAAEFSSTLPCAFVTQTIWPPALSKHTLSTYNVDCRATADDTRCTATGPPKSSPLYLLVPHRLAIGRMHGPARRHRQRVVGPRSIIRLGLRRLPRYAQTSPLSVVCHLSQPSSTPCIGTARLTLCPLAPTLGLPGRDMRMRE